MGVCVLVAIAHSVLRLLRFLNDFETGCVGINSLYQTLSRDSDLYD